MSLGYDFPPELDIFKEVVGISFTFPKEKEAMFEDAKQKYQTNNGKCIFRPHRKKEDHYLIAGPGTKPEDQIEALLFVLNEMGLFVSNSSLPHSIPVTRFFKPDIKSDITREEYLAIEDPHLAPFNASITTVIQPNIENFNNPLTIDPVEFMILTKALSPELKDLKTPYEEIFIHHDNEKKIIKLLLPSLLPVAFQFMGDKDEEGNLQIDKFEIEVTFVDYDKYTAAQIKEQFQTALDNLHKCLCLRVYFDNCETFDYLEPNFKIDPEILKQLYIGFAEEIDRLDDDISSSYLYAVVPPGVEGGEALLLKFKEELPKLLDQCKLLYCKNCKYYYQIGDESTCYDPSHVGKRVRFPSGEMEEIQLPDDSPEFVERLAKEKQKLQSREEKFKKDVEELKKQRELTEEDEKRIKIQERKFNRQKERLQKEEEPVTLHKWTCCGEIPEYYLCESDDRKTLPAHEESDENPNPSDYTTSDIKTFGELLQEIINDEE